MPLVEQLNQELVTAQKAKEALTVEVLRSLLAALKNEQIKAKKDKFKDDEVLKVLKSEAKKRQDSISAFEKGGRKELAEKEEKELTIIQKYLPAQLSEEEVLKKIKAVQEKTGLSDFGPLMGKVMSELGAQADGALVKKLVQEVLNN